MRTLLLTALIIFGPLHAWLAYEWTTLHGFFGAILHWLESAKLDPIYAAAVVDFLTVIGLVGLWFLNDYKSKGGKLSVKFMSWSALYLVLPSIGILTYFLWIRPTPKTN